MRKNDPGASRGRARERELTDALLQDFQGVLLKFHAASALILDDPTQARHRLDEALLQADSMMAAARDALEKRRRGRR